MPETKMPEPQPGPQPGRWVLSHGEIRTIVFGLMLAMFLAALNQTIVATALPTIGRDFRDFELLPWIVTAYLLSSTVVAPLYGKLSDIYGRRPMMLASIGIFVAGSAACAAAHDMIMLILGRGLQGRYSPIGASDSCRRGRAPRARPLPGLYGERLGYRGARRSSRRRHSDRALPLVNHLLVQCSVGAGRSHHGAQEPQGPAAPRPQAQARPARRRPDGGLGNPAAAGAHLGRVALSLAFRTHCRAGPGRSRTVVPVHLAVDEGFRAVPAAACPRQSGGAYGHRVHFVLARRGDRAHHLPAALLRGRAQIHGKRLRPRAHSHRRDVDTRIDPGRSRDDVSQPLQARADRRPLVLDRGALGPGLESGNTADLGRRSPERGRVRHRHHLSGRHGLDSECRVALPGRGRHGSDELLPWTDRGVHCSDHGRHPAGDSRRCARTRGPRHGHDRNGGKRTWRRSGTRFPGLVRVRGPVPDRKPGRLDPHGGASAARPGLNWRSVNTRSRSEKWGCRCSSASASMSARGWRMLFFLDVPARCFSGSKITSALERSGVISLSSSSHFPVVAWSMLVNPVMLPSGRAKFETKPRSIGSATLTNTIGTVRVACRSSNMTCVVSARITSGAILSSSAA